MTQAYPRWFSRALYVLMALAILIRLFYWHYTDRTWEDALISVLHSENAARGLGLTHLQPPGEPPLHGFTSPLSVLIPLMGDLVRVGWGVSFLKLVSAFAAPIAVWLSARISQVIDLPPSLALTAAAYVAFEHHQILWGMSGMETEVVVVAYLASIYALQRGTQWQKGLSLGFVMLARPDGALWVAIALAVELWRARQSKQWRGLIPVGAGILLLYGPWLLFTTLYYGGPVPNTIHAKSLGYAGFWTQLQGNPQKAQWLWARLHSVLGSLGIVYGGNGTGFMPFWHGRIPAEIMMCLYVVGVILAVKRRRLQTLLVFAFGLTFVAYLYFCDPFVFGWYTVPVVAAVMIGSLYGFWGLAQLFLAPPLCDRVVIAAGALYILLIVSVLPLTFRSDKYLQIYVEDGVRKQVGLFIARVSLPTDTVASESMGYVGYYSGRVVYDYPGLCSRDVVRYLREHPDKRDLIDMMHALRPTYLVLRQPELFGADGKYKYPWIPQDYDLVGVFQAPPIARQKILHSDMNIDFNFDVLRRKGAPYVAQQVSHMLQRRVDPDSLRQALTSRSRFVNRACGVDALTLRGHSMVNVVPLPGSD